MWVVVAGTSLAPWSFTRRSTVEPWTDLPTLGADDRELRGAARAVGGCVVRDGAGRAGRPHSLRHPTSAGGQDDRRGDDQGETFGLLRTVGSLTSERLLGTTRRGSAPSRHGRWTSNDHVPGEVDIRGKVPRVEPPQHLRLERRALGGRDRAGWPRGAGSSFPSASKRGHVDLVGSARLARVDVGLDLELALELGRSCTGSVGPGPPRMSTW